MSQNEKTAKATTIAMTQEVLISLEQELLMCKTEIRSDILEKLTTAKAHGDLKENGEYDAMRAAQGENEGRIRLLESRISQAIIIEKGTSQSIGLTSQVILEKSDTKEEKKVTIVSLIEADITKQWIADSSPLGSALLGKTKGDTVSVQTPKGEVEYVIKDVT
jgi:transcription elongation factor GreA